MTRCARLDYGGATDLGCMLDGELYVTGRPDGTSTRRVIALVEPGEHHPELNLLAGRIGAAARHTPGVRIEECVFLPRGQFPKTPSGKIQRYRCREIAAGRPDAAYRNVAPRVTCVALTT